MPTCKKCQKTISKGNLCERCSSLRIDKIKKIGTGVILPVASLALMVISKGKINPKSKDS